MNVFFVIFILAGLSLGTGTMLAPAVPTRQPRIAACGVFTFAFVLSGAVFYGATFGWDTLVVDYLWFAIIIGIFLGGTLTIGMQRMEEAHAAGETYRQGWPGVIELSFFAFWTVVIIVMVLFITPDTVLHDGDAILTEVDVLQSSKDFTVLRDLPGEFSPGVPALVAYLDRQLTPELDDILYGLLITMHLLMAWQLYDLGREISGDDRTGWAAMIFAGVFLLAFPLNYTLVVTVNFVLGAWFFALRWQRWRRYFDGFAAAVCATAAIMADYRIVMVLIVLYPLLLVIVSKQYVDAGPPVHRRDRLQRSPVLSWGLIPLLTLFALIPWLLAI